MRIHVVVAGLLGLSAAFGQPFEVERLDGQRLRVRNFGEHKVTAVVFLSARSADGAEAARLANRRYRRAGAMVVAIFSDPAESAADIRDYCQDSGLVFPCYRDPEGTTAKEFGVKAPAVVLLDSTGTATYKGTTAGLGKAIARHLGLAEPSGASPGGPYGSISYSSELIFERIPSAPAQHASSLAEAASGDLVATWYAASYESADDESLYLARRRRGERTWSRPAKVIAAGEKPVGNAIIFTDGLERMWIVWGQLLSTQPLLPHTGWADTKLFYRISGDHGYTWSADREFPFDTAGWLPRNLPITLASGRIVLPLSDERGDKDLSFFLITDDNGTTWRRSKLIPNPRSQGEQPTVAVRPDGSLWALLRTGPRLLETESRDEGESWSPAQATELRNPDAAIALRTLRNGHVILVWNNVEKGRTPLHIARSTDGGKTWGEVMMLESNPGEYSYPVILETGDGMIHVTYTYRRYSIKHVEFNEDWLYRIERPN